MTGEHVSIGRSLLDYPSVPVPDSELLEFVTWPDRGQLQADQVRETFSSVRRFIDFDGTVAAKAQPENPRQTICDRPLAEFLGEEPYIIQTWNPASARRFFEELLPDLPKPVLIIVVPVFFISERDSFDGVGKDFSVFNIIDKEIVDDEPPEKIRAPGCRVLRP